jgi:hypothetical protein
MGFCTSDIRQCVEENCAWWNAAYVECAVLTIPTNIRKSGEQVSKSLDDIYAAI